MATAPTVTDLPAAGGELEERKTEAFEGQAAAMERHAAALERIASLQATVAAPLLTSPKAERFERVLRACVEGRVATTVEGFLDFARELCDGIDREFPTPGV